MILLLTQTFSWQAKALFCIHERFYFPQETTNGFSFFILRRQLLSFTDKTGLWGFFVGCWGFLFVFVGWFVYSFFLCVFFLVFVCWLVWGFWGVLFLAFFKVTDFQLIIQKIEVWHKNSYCASCRKEDLKSMVGSSSTVSKPNSHKARKNTST